MYMTCYCWFWLNYTRCSINCACMLTVEDTRYTAVGFAIFSIPFAITVVALMGDYFTRSDKLVKLALDPTLFHNFYNHENLWKLTCFFGLLIFGFHCFLFFQPLFFLLLIFRRRLTALDFRFQLKFVST